MSKMHERIAASALGIILVLSFVGLSDQMGAFDFTSCKEQATAGTCGFSECCLNGGSATCACEDDGSCSTWSGATCDDLGDDLPEEPPQQ